MKKLFYGLLILFCALSVFGQATNTVVSINLTDVRLQAAPYYTNRTLWINSMNVPNANSPSVVLGATIYGGTDTNGIYYLSNAQPYLYQVTVRASPYGGQQELFKFLVITNNMGLINAADNLVAMSTATFPAGAVAWAAAVTDSRYFRQMTSSNGSVSFLPASGLPGPNGVIDLAAVGGGGGTGSSNITDNGYSAKIRNVEVSTNAVFDGLMIGSGAALTNLNATNLIGGPVPLGPLTAATASNLTINASVTSGESFVMTPTANRFTFEEFSGILRLTNSVFNDWVQWNGGFTVGNGLNSLVNLWGAGGPGQGNIDFVGVGSGNGAGFTNLNAFVLTNAAPRGVVYPEQFGAVGNGVADDTTAFGNAMNYVMQRVYSNGNYKLVCPNQYFIAGNLPSITNGLTIEGVHSWTMIPTYNAGQPWPTNSTITFGGSNGFYQTLTTNALVGLVLKDLTLVGPGHTGVNTNSFAVNVGTTSAIGSDQNIQVSECNIINFGHGVVWTNTAASTVEKCWFDSCNFVFEQYGASGQSINNVLDRVNASSCTVNVIVPDGQLTLLGCGLSGSGNFGTFKSGSDIVTYDPVSLRLGGSRIVAIGCAFESTSPYMIDLRGAGSGDCTFISCNITPPAGKVGILLSNNIVKLQNNNITGDGAGNQLVTQDANPQIFPDIRSQVIVSNWTSGGVTTGWPQNIRNGMFIDGFFGAAVPTVPPQSRVVVTSVGDGQMTLNLPVLNNAQFGYYINPSIIGGSGNFGLTIGEVNNGTPSTNNAFVIRDNNAGPGPTRFGFNTNNPQATVDINGSLLIRGAETNNTFGAGVLISDPNGGRSSGSVPNTALASSYNLTNLVVKANGNFALQIYDGWSESNLTTGAWSYMTNGCLTMTNPTAANSASIILCQGVMTVYNGPATSTFSNIQANGWESVSGGFTNGGPAVFTNNVTVLFGGQLNGLGALTNSGGYAESNSIFGIIQSQGITATTNSGPTITLTLATALQQLSTNYMGGVTNSGGSFLTNPIFGIIQSGATTNNGIVTLAASGSGTNAWQLNGNGGNGVGAFLGTTDGQPLIMKVFNTQVGRFDGNVGGSWAIDFGNGNSIGSLSEGSILGGINNTNNSLDTGIIVGGVRDFVTGAHGQFIGGGTDNTVTNQNYGVIVGGQSNIVSADYGMILGGLSNGVTGKYGVSLGTRAQATNQGAFVFSDSQSAAFSSTNSDSFNVRAQGGAHFFTSGGLSIFDSGVQLDNNLLISNSAPSAVGALMITNYSQLSEQNTGNTNTTFVETIQNYSALSNAQSAYQAIADNGNAAINNVLFGINSSVYTNGTLGLSNDAFLYLNSGTNGRNLFIGTLFTNRNSSYATGTVSFVIGTTNNVVAVVNSNSVYANWSYPFFGLGDLTNSGGFAESNSIFGIIQSQGITAATNSGPTVTLTLSGPLQLLSTNYIGGLTNQSGLFISNSVFGIIQTGATTNNGVVTLAGANGTGIQTNGGTGTANLLTNLSLYGTLVGSNMTITLSNASPIAVPLITLSNYGTTSISAQGNTNTPFQILLQNSNSGSNAAGQFLVRADNGDALHNFLAMGFNSSTFTNQGLVGLTNDATIGMQGNTNSQNLFIYNLWTNRNSLFSTGAVGIVVGSSSNVVEYFTSNSVYGQWSVPHFGLGDLTNSGGFAESNAVFGIIQSQGLTATTNSGPTVTLTLAGPLQNLSTNQAGTLTNLNAGALTGYVYTVNADASALWPGDTLPPTWLTNTPGTTSTSYQTNGLSFKAWSISQTATNNLLFQGVIPKYYGGGAITAAVYVVSGTNQATQVTNVWSFAAATIGTSLGTAVTFTNNLPITTGPCYTNWASPGITINGNVFPGNPFLLQVQPWGGSPVWKGTNVESLLQLAITFPVTNAPYSSASVP